LTTANQGAICEAYRVLCAQAGLWPAEIVAGANKTQGKKPKKSEICLDKHKKNDYNLSVCGQKGRIG